MEQASLGRQWVALGAILVAALILYPFTQALYLPLTDIPNHIARHTIMAADETSALGLYWTSNFVIVPNSAVDLLWQMIGQEGHVIEFSHAVMAFAALNLFVSALVLARVVHGAWTWWSLAAGLIVFNATFLFGFQNYVFSLPFAIYAFALYLAFEERPLWLRACVFLALTPILFLMHFFAFGVLGAMAFGREAQKLVEAKGARLGALARGALMGVPFVLPVLWLLIGMATGPENPAGTYSEFGSWMDRVIRWQTPLYTWATDLTANLNVTAFLIVLCLYALFATALFKSRFGLMVAPAMRGPVLALLAAALLAPNWLAGVALINLRFPFVFVLVMIAASQLHLPAKRHAILVMALVIAMIGVRSGQIATWWSSHDTEIRDLAALMEDTLEPGDRLMPVRAPDAFQDSRQWHVQAYAVALSEAFIPTLFQGVHAVQLRPEWEDHATPLMHANPACALFEDAAPELYRGQRICRAEPYTRDWGEKFTKVLAMEPLPATLLEHAPLERIGTKGRYEMYRVIDPAQGPARALTGS